MSIAAAASTLAFMLALDELSYDTFHIAQILFQNEDPIGKTVTDLNNLQLEVTSIAEQVFRIN